MVFLVFFMIFNLFLSVLEGAEILKLVHTNLVQPNDFDQTSKYAIQAWLSRVS